jgi:hypothetical protein
VTSEGLFNVYIERARSEAPDAGAKLAQAMASHYGIDAKAVEERLAVGRFRVKGNVPRATADAFAADLQKLGAIVKVESASAEEATPPPPAGPAAAPAGKPAKRNRTPPTGVKIPPISLQQPRVSAPSAKGVPTPVAKPASPSPAAKTPTPPPSPAAKPQFSSGLAAAAAKPAGDDGLGALGGEMPLTLSSLDGVDDTELSASRNIGLPASFGPPPSAPAQRPSASSPAMSEDDVDVAMDDDDDESVEMPVPLDEAALPASVGSAPLPASIGPAALPASMGPAAGVRALGASASPSAPALGGAQDMFAPPEAAAEMALALDVETVRKKPPVAPEPPVLAEAPAESAPGGARVSTRQAAVRAPSGPAWKTYGKDERVRFVAGVVVAAALGCIPALVTSSVRKRSAFADLDSQLERQQSQILTRTDWDNLDRVRASFIERKKAEQQSIAVTSLLLWVIVSGGVAFVWFRKIDWDRIFR